MLNLSPPGAYTFDYTQKSGGDPLFIDASILTAKITDEILA